MMLLLTYMADLGGLVVLFFDSIRVHDWCVNEFFVYADQYCSWSISIANLEEVGSLRTLCVRSFPFCMLYCRISMVVFGFGLTW